MKVKTLYNFEAHDVARALWHTINSSLKCCNKQSLWWKVAGVLQPTTCEKKHARMAKSLYQMWARNSQELHSVYCSVVWNKQSVVRTKAQ